jgi:hypothetical protein
VSIPNETRPKLKELLQFFHTMTSRDLFCTRRSSVHVRRRRMNTLYTIVFAYKARTTFLSVWRHGAYGLGQPYTAHVLKRAACKHAARCSGQA